ncbi:MAG: ATP-binding protein [Pseudomonadota bacterium]
MQSFTVLRPVNRLGAILAPTAPWFLLAGVGFSGTGLVIGDPVYSLGLLISGGVFGLIGLLVVGLTGQARISKTGRAGSLDRVLQHDTTPHLATDRDGKVTYMNPAATDRFGAVTGQTMARALDGLFANPSAVLFRLQNRATSEDSAREDVVTRRSHMRLSVHRIGEGAFLWRLDDLFERSNAGRGMDGISLPMLTVSKAGTVLFMNEAFRALLGSRVKTLDRIFTELPVKSGTVATLSAADGQKQVFVTRLEGAAGRSEIYCLPVADNTVADDHAHDPMIEALPVAMMRIDADGRLEEINRLAAACFDRPAEKGIFVSDLLEGLGRSVSDWLKEAQEGRGLGRPEVLKVQHPDKEIYLQVALARVEGAKGPGLLAVLNDATELKTLEAQFVQSQKMQAIGQLAGGVAHDFNNLLTAISGHCDLLLLRHDQGDPEYGDLVQIHQNANRAASLVGQLLAFSRKQNLQPETLDLRDTLGDLTHLLNRLVGERVRLSLVHDPSALTVRADKRQLEQVLMNLVVNARDAMPSGGTITIETERTVLEGPVERDRARVPAGEYVVVKVSDEGVGIPPDKISKIFEPFYTTKRTGEGTGLGLSTAYGIVKQTGGFIFADSTPGQGAVFSIYLPIHYASASPALTLPSRKSASTAQRGEGVVLLVEDEAPVRAFASRALRMRGYTVLEASNAEEALATLEDSALAVDVFVTDVIMPGLDGPTWVAEALKKRPGVRVVFVSGYAEEALSEQQARIPNAVFLPKPFSLSELATTVHNQLH